MQLKMRDILFYTALIVGVVSDAAYVMMLFVVSTEADVMRAGFGYIGLLIVALYMFDASQKMLKEEMDNEKAS